MVQNKRKFRLLFCPKGKRRPGPNGPSKELIDAIVASKQRNQPLGCPRIAQQMDQPGRPHKQGAPTGDDPIR